MTSSIITRAEKGASLTFAEMDTNWNNIRNLFRGGEDAPTAGGTADVLTITSSELAVTSLVDNLTVACTIASANTTTTPTLNVDGLGAKTIKNNDGTALTVGQLKAGTFQILKYEFDDDSFRVITPAITPSDLGTAAYEDIQTSTTDSTSGRALTVGAFGLGTGNPPSIADLNTGTVNGWYEFSSPSNAPSFATGVLFVAARANGVRVSQIAMKNDGSLANQTLAYREFDGTTWGSWREILKQGDTAALASLTLTTDLAVTEGGTGSSTASGARTNLGVAIGSDVQAYDADLTAIGALAKTDGNFIVGNGSTWVAESGSTARTSLGLGSLATASTVSNTNWSGTDLAVTNGGTGASDAGTARTNLGLGSLATASTINNGNWSGTDLAVTNGGTGASDASTARTNLGAAATSHTHAASDITSGTFAAARIPVAVNSASSGQGFGGFRYTISGTTLNLFTT